jgi:hypothetical protein
MFFYWIVAVGEIEIMLTDNDSEKVGRNDNTSHDPLALGKFS